MLASVTFFLECQGTEVVLTNSDGGFRYKYIGCYKDPYRSNRALPIRYFNARKYIDWKKEDFNFKKVIDMCAVHARNRSDLTHFGVQFYGECWGGQAGSRYDAYGKSENCMKGAGGGWTNAVYKLISECEVSGKTYNDGDSFYIPQNPIQYNDISCQSCSCDRGAKSCRGKIMCDFFFPCEKFTPALPGECCPTCACYHKDKFYQDGQSWINRQQNAPCFECACVSNQAKCVAKHCPTDCPNPVYEPDKCCPTCHPGAPPTESPAFTLPKTTTRPPPVMPPFPGFPGNQKRGLKLKKRTKRSNS